MKKLSYLLAVVAISGLALMPTSSSASPLASGFAFNSATFPGLNEGFQKVQIWSCREKFSDMTVEQRHFCRGYAYDYGPRYGYGYRYGGYGYPYGGFGLGIPFFGFGFGFDDDHHHGWRRHGHHRKWRRRHY